MHKWKQVKSYVGLYHPPGDEMPYNTVLGDYICRNCGLSLEGEPDVEPLNIQSECKPIKGEPKR